MRLPPRTWTHAPSRAAKDRHRALTSTAMPLQVRAAALPSTLHAGLPARRHPTCGTEPVMTLDANTHKSSPRSRVRGHITSNSGGSSPTLAPSPCSTSVPNDTRVITLPCSMKHGIYISGKGGGLIPMTSFRAVMDASWCATVRPATIPSRPAFLRLYLVIPYHAKHRVPVQAL
ncbi:hypothetical protein BC834DRAFT_601848 [Gloeopeniophorella convolvens]|nr:hypothetical protein BC834DRAFT_601848 [Gloeopeniophorella convolvens]